MQTLVDALLGRGSRRTLRAMGFQRFLGNAPRGFDLPPEGREVSGICEYGGVPFLRFGTALVSANPRVSKPTRNRMFDTSKPTRQPDCTCRNRLLQFPGIRRPRSVIFDLALRETYQLTVGVRAAEARNAAAAGLLGRRLRHVRRLRWEIRVARSAVGRLH